MSTEHRLWGMRGYLGGPIDKAPDGGKGWRTEFTPFLNGLGVIVMDPCNKPISTCFENTENLQYRTMLKDNGKFDQLSAEFDPIRNVDLRMVDISDFLIINIDLDIYQCGTMEEMTIANLQLKPIFIRCKQGKNKAPDWLFAMIPHQYIYGSWDGIKEHLCHIHSDPVVMEPGKRWKFFNYAQMQIATSPDHSTAFAEYVLKGK